ncbi:MAG: hypothetical protein MJ131_08960 [Lachnospiraceae bacterium]|nr:hypothetical protein [Lachnospiraceae bacterium]
MKRCEKTVKYGKRVLVFVLVLAMLTVSLPMAGLRVYAGDNGTNDNLTFFSLEIRVGDAVTISRQGALAGKKVVWKSSKKKVASVIEKPTGISESDLSAIDFHDGEAVIKGLSEGVATITATAEDGTKGTCKITVKSAGVTVKENRNNEYSSTVSQEQGNTLLHNQVISGVLGQAGINMCEENESGQTVFNHPSGMVSFQKNNKYYIVVTDTWNNRTLIYKGKSYKAARKAVPIVLGQQNLSSSKSGRGMDQMNWPLAVAVDSSGRLYVCDTHNYRILVWDNIAKIKNGMPADHAIEWWTSDKSEKDNKIDWPWSIAITKVNGRETMVVANTGQGSVLIWETLPKTWEEDQANYYPSLILKYATDEFDGVTPRAITTNGKSLIVGDENLMIDHRVTSGLRVMTSFPTEKSLNALAKKNGAQKTELQAENGDRQLIYRGDMYNFIFAENEGYSSGCYDDKGRLYLQYAGNIHIWNDGCINSRNDEPDIAPFSLSDSYSKENGFWYNGGGMNQLMFAGGELYVCMFNGNGIMGYTAKGVEKLQKVTDNNRSATYPQFTLGYDTTKYSLEMFEMASDYIIHNPIVETDGEILLVASDLDKKLYVWKEVPTDSGVLPDYEYTVPFEAAAVTMHKDKNGKRVVILASRTHSVLYIWSDFKADGSLPDKIIGKHIGSQWYGCDEITDIEYDGEYLFLAKGDMTICYKGIPGKNSEPFCVLEDGGRISSNGDYIAAVSVEHDSIHIYEKGQMKKNATLKPKYVIDTMYLGEGRDFTYDENRSREDSQTLVLPSEVDWLNTPERIHFSAFGVEILENGMLAVADMGENRVIVWNSVEDAINDKEILTILGHGKEYYNVDDLILASGGTANAYRYPIGHSTEDSLNMPRYIAFDGKNLWIGEFKFASRLVRFALQ